MALFGDVDKYDVGVETTFAHEIRKGRLRERGLRFGEHYKFQCPFCDDHKKHCWVNHLYGSSPGIGLPSRTRGFWGCYRRACHEDKDNQEQMEVWLGSSGASPIVMGAQGQREEAELTAVPLPGRCVPLELLPADHDVMAYLKLERHFDPLALSQHFRVHYCCGDSPPEHRAANYRIIIPAFFDGMMVGWQARAVGSAGLRYYSRPGRPSFRSHTLYNWDHARRSRVLIVVEGVTSVWRLGHVAVAAYGHAITWQQLDWIRTWAADGGQALALLFDAQGVDDKERSRTLERLKTAVPPSRVVDVRLPAPDDADGKKDPADYDRPFGLRLVASRLRQSGMGADADWLLGRPKYHVD